jgi:signal transduction histidine kinase
VPQSPVRAKSIAGRLIAAAALWVALMLVVGGLLLSNLFREPIEQSFEQRLGFLLDTLIAAVDLTPDGQAIQRQPMGEPRFLRQYSGWYWQVGSLESGKVLGRSRSMWDFEIPLPAAGGNDATERSYALDGPLSQKLQVLEKRITEEGVPGAYVFLVATDRADLVAAIGAFNITLLWSLGVLGVGLIAAIFLQVRFGLLPLQRIRRALADVRDGRADRLAGDFPNEIRPLADELNGLLDHTNEVLARARAHVGNLAHALKTPLAVLTNEGERPSEDVAAVVNQQTALMRRHVDHHLARARAIGQASLLRSHIPLLPVLQSLARTLEKIHERAGVTITVDAEERLAFRGEQNDLEEMLGNLLDNACKWAASEVTLRAESVSAPGAGGLQIRLVIDDDGPGIAPDLRSEIFDRGRRGDETKPGSGLGLAIVRDIATLYGGHVDIGDIPGNPPESGLRAILTLPGARAH